MPAERTLQVREFDHRQRRIRIADAVPARYGELNTPIRFGRRRSTRRTRQLFKQLSNLPELVEHGLVGLLRRLGGHRTAQRRNERNTENTDNHSTQDVIHEPV